MSEGATSGAPGAAAPTAAATTPANTPPQAKSKPVDATPAWGEKDDAELLERFKRSPYGKLKVNGKEEGIESIEDLKRRNLDAMRGRGANRFVEEAKKTAEEAKREAGEAKALKSALERARRGDGAALRELGLVPDDERQRAEQEFSKLPPEVQEVLRQNYELSERLTARERAEQQRVQQEEMTLKERKKQEVLSKAKSLLPELMADIREEYADIDLPDVLQVMETLRSEGARLGVDYDATHVKQMVEQLREGGVDGRMKQLKPDAAAKRLAPTLAAMKPNELKAALGEHFMPIAKAISKAYVAAVKGERNKPAAGSSSAPTRPAETQKPRGPLVVGRRF